MYVTYGIVDPKSLAFVYIGQTNNFERRKNEHLMAHRLRKAPPKDSIQYWLRRTIKAGQEPLFVALDSVASESESLASELEWVEKFAAIGHPLYNRWEEHRERIEAHLKPPKSWEAIVFLEDEAMKIGTAQENRNKTGFRVFVEDWFKPRNGAQFTIDLLPPKEE